MEICRKSQKLSEISVALNLMLWLVDLRRSLLILLWNHERSFEITIDLKSSNLRSLEIFRVRHRFQIRIRDHRRSLKFTVDLKLLTIYRNHQKSSEICSKLSIHIDLNYFFPGYFDVWLCELLLDSVTPLQPMILITEKKDFFAQEFCTHPK